MTLKNRTLVSFYPKQIMIGMRSRIYFKKNCASSKSRKQHPTYSHQDLKAQVDELVARVTRQENDDMNAHFLGIILSFKRFSTTLDRKEGISL